MRKELSFQVKQQTFGLGRRTWIMGVLNVTPDSFSDGGLHLDPEKAIGHGLALLAEGADILDIGGESSRPGADPVAAEEEIRRIVPVLSGLRKQTQALISVDTTKFDVAQAAFDHGADILNDISSFSLDPRLLDLAGRYGAGFILMHMQGNPKTMQLRPFYENVLKEIHSFLADKIEVAQAYGLKKESILIDPGIGFGKRFEDNLTLLNRLDFFEDLERPILVGVSRKSFIGKILNSPPQDRLEGTIAASVVSILRGASVLRSHDVKAVRRAVLVAEAILCDYPAAEGRDENKTPYVH